MNKLFISIVAACYFITFFIYLLGLMKLFPIYLAAPPLFLTILIILHSLNNRRRFRLKK